MVQRLIVGVLVVSSHISLCGGTLLSSTAILAAEFSGAETRAYNMSPDVRSPLCMMSTPAIAAETQQASASNQHTCSGDSCTTLHATALHAPTPLIVDAIIVSAKIASVQDAIADQSAPVPRDRDDPYAYSRRMISSVIALE